MVRDLVLQKQDLLIDLYQSLRIDRANLKIGTLTTKEIKM